MALLVSVPVGGAFGEAAAEGTVTGDGLITVEIEVEVPGASAVVAHFVDPGDDQRTVAMNPRTGDVFAASAEVEQADLVVVFEILNGAEVVVSRPLNLSELGVDPAVLGAVVAPNLLTSDPEEVPDEGVLTPEIRRNLWLAVALAAGALSLLAVWAAGPRSSPSQGSGPSAGPSSGPGLKAPDSEPSEADSLPLE